MGKLRWRNRLKCDGEIGCFYSSANKGQWSQQRVFSEASAAEGFAEPADRPAPTEGRRRALGRRAREIVDEIVEKRGLKKE